jgi:hypothetical protein
MERAYNPKTDEYVFLVNNEWVKPTDSAVNPKTGERALLVGNEWQIVPGQKPAAPAAAAPASAAAPNKAPTNLGAPVQAPAEAEAEAGAPAAKTTRGFDIGAIPDQFKSGVASMQQAWFTNAAKNALQNLEVMNRIDRGEKVPDAQDPTGYQHLGPKERAQVRAEFESVVPKNVSKIVSYTAEQEGYTKNPNAELMVKQLNKKNWKAAWNTFTDDPAGIIQQMSVQSAPNALPSLIGGAAGVLLRGGIPAMMVGLGTGSFPVEYMASLVDSLNDAKVNLKDAEAVEAKLRDPKFLEAAGKKAAATKTSPAKAAADPSPARKAPTTTKSGRLRASAVRVIRAADS